ncbi:MAG: ribosome-associated translation inhibitor RaiA [bacterium]
MNIKIRTANFDLTPAIEDYIYKKLPSLEKFLNKDGNVLCEVEIGKTTSHHKSGDIFKAEVNITESHGNQFYALAEESDLYAAIDVVRDEMERIIVAKKKKANTLFRRGASKIKNIIKKINGK